jgi:N utilization substance protein A
VIVPDDQLSLAIGRDGQNARLAARLTGWKVDITSETEFAQQEEAGEIEYEGEEAADGRCMALMTTGRRCPNAALEGSHYCGLPQHQALARFSTNQVAVLGPLGDDEVATLADSDADEGAVKPIVEKAESQFDEAAAEAEAEEAAAEEDEAEETEEPAADEEEAEETEEPAADEEEADAEEATASDDSDESEESEESEVAEEVEAEVDAVDEDEQPAPGEDAESAESEEEAEEVEAEVDAAEKEEAAG